MPICPQCLTRFPDEDTTCPHDGTALAPDSAYAYVDRDLAPGDVVGEYVVEGKLGEGGFGSVYAAAHPVIGKRAAVKVLSRTFSANPQMVSRFIAEARAVNQIRHRNIIDIFSFGQLPDGRQYYVMELLDGMTFDAHLERQGRLSFPQALPILRGIARALDAAHAKGLLHRDLKPENVFLVFDEDGGVLPKLLDFGLVKLLGSASGQHKTKTGTPMGTPLYMSPEQVRSLKNVDHRSDVWALGSILFELVTGRPIFEAPSASALCAMIAMDPPIPLRARLPSAPPGLEAVILRCLHKDPAGRFQDVAQLAEALAPFGTERGRASATRVSRVVRSSGSSGGGLGGSGGVPALTPGGQGIAHLGAPGEPGSSPTVDAVGRVSNAPHQLLGAPGPAWSRPPPGAHPGYGPTPIAPNGSMRPAAVAGSAMPPPAMHRPGHHPNGTQSTWQHTNTGHLTQTGEKRGMSAALVAMLGVLTGVVLLLVIVGGVWAYVNAKQDQAGVQADAGVAPAAQLPVDAGAAATLAVADSGALKATTASTGGAKPGIVVPAGPAAKKDAGAPSTPPPAAVDAGAPSGGPKPPPRGLTPAEELEAKRRNAQAKCDHLSFQLAQNKAPDNNAAKSIKLQTCWQDPERPMCERTMCIRACQILNDKMCIDMMERHNRTSPPPI